MENGYTERSYPPARDGGHIWPPDDMESTVPTGQARGSNAQGSNAQGSNASGDRVPAGRPSQSPAAQPPAAHPNGHESDRAPGPALAPPSSINPTTQAMPIIRPPTASTSPWAQPPTPAARRPPVEQQPDERLPDEQPTVSTQPPPRTPVTPPPAFSPLAPPPAAPPPAPTPEAPGVYRMPPPSAYPLREDTAARMPEAFVPTADEFARRRAARPPEPVATMGARATLRKTTLGLVRLGPGRRELEFRHDVEMVRRNFGGLRQVTVVNPKGGAGKTVAALLLGMTFGQRRGGYVLTWDNNETQGTLGMRAQQDFHARTVRDLLRDLDHFAGAHGRVGDLSQYVRAQGEGMFDVLASDESATAGEMLTSSAFAEIREVVSRFYKLIIVDTGNNVRAANWQAAIDATDQLVVTMSARNDSAETAARMLDHLEQAGRQRLVRQAVTIVSMPPSRRELDVPAIQRHFAARTRAVLMAPYELLIDSGEPIRYSALSSSSRIAWLKIASAVAEGL